MLVLYRGRWEQGQGLGIHLSRHELAGGAYEAAQARCVPHGTSPRLCAFHAARATIGQDLSMEVGALLDSDHSHSSSAEGAAAGTGAGLLTADVAAEAAQLLHFRGSRMMLPVQVCAAFVRVLHCAPAELERTA
jgi:hypothetical protein